jgi:hypothetical protein
VADRAAAHFDQGTTALERRDFPTAIREFEAAHALLPNASVLYNIARAYLELERPLDAIVYFERYLEEEDEHPSQGRRMLVERQVGELRSRVGQLVVRVEPETATITVDGEPLTIAPQSGAIVLPGKRQLRVEAEGYLPAEQTLEVSVGTRQTIALFLESTPPPPVPPAGFLLVRCELPDVTVTVNERRVATTEGVPLRVPVVAGAARVRLSRPGYRPRMVKIEVQPNRPAPLDCALDPLSGSQYPSTRLAIPPGLDASRVRVNGGAVPASLPLGRHHVAVALADGSRWQTTVTAKAGRPVRLALPTHVAPSAPETRRRVRAPVAWFSAAGAFGLTSAILYGASEAKHRSYVRDQGQLDEDRWDDPSDPTLGERQNEIDADIQTFERLDMAAAVFLGAAITAVGGGVAAWVTDRRRPGAMSGRGRRRGRE